MGPDIEWERYEYTTPKGNKIEVIREIVYGNYGEEEWVG